MAILPSLHIFFCNFYFLIFFEKFFFFKTHKNTYKNLFVDDQNYYWSTSSSMTSWKKRETIYSVGVFIKGAIVFLSIDEFYHCEYDIDIECFLNAFPISSIMKPILYDLIYKHYLLHYIKHEFLGYNAKRSCSHFI